MWQRSGVACLYAWLRGATWVQPEASRDVAVPAGPIEVPPTAHRSPSPPAPRAAERSATDIEEWLRRDPLDAAPRGSRGQVEDWLTSDPFAGVEHPAARDVSEWLPVPPVVREAPAAAAVPPPATLLERLDVFHQGLVRLEQFVARAAKLEEAAAHPAEPDARPVAATVLPFRAAS